MKVDYFISEYKELIEELQGASPETKIIIQSIPPVDARLDINNSLNNKKINDFNYHLLKMCSELNLPFLNSAEALKDSNGTCKTGLCVTSDGIHQTKDGYIKLVNYLKNHYTIE
jgi:lysophospholipase L1-like esterase